jgi:hypothetical protein
MQKWFYSTATSGRAASGENRRQPRFARRAGFACSLDSYAFSRSGTAQRIAPVTF